MEYSGEKWRKLEDQFMRSNVQTELPERHQGWQWAEKNCCLWQCAVTRGPTLRPWGEGWGLQKGIWLIRSAKVARHTNPALGLSNRRYLRGMIPSESKTGTRLRAHRDWEGGCPRELGERDVRWGCGRKWSQKPLDLVENGLGMAFWRLYQWNQETTFSQLFMPCKTNKNGHWGNQETLPLAPSQPRMSCVTMET